MSLLRVRSTVGRMMVAVAVVGVVSALLVECERRRDRFRSLARAYRGRAIFRAMDRQACVLMARTTVPSEGGRHLAEDSRGARLRGYLEGMERKYERAALYPFLPVAPDPPEPE